MYYLFASAAVNTAIWKLVSYSQYSVKFSLVTWSNSLHVLVCSKGRNTPKYVLLVWFNSKGIQFWFWETTVQQESQCWKWAWPLQTLFFTSTKASRQEHPRNTIHGATCIPISAHLSRRQVGTNSSAIYEVWHFCNIQNYEFQKCFHWQENILQSGGRNLLRGFHSSKMELQRHYYSEKGAITITIKYLCF